MSLFVRYRLIMVKEKLPSWVHQDSDEGLVHVNVGGLKRSLCSSTLKKFPDTRLGKLLACDSEEAILEVGVLTQEYMCGQLVGRSYLAILC